MSTASFSTNVIIPSELPVDVVHWKRADVQAFLDGPRNRQKQQDRRHSLAPTDRRKASTYQTKTWTSNKHRKPC